MLKNLLKKFTIKAKLIFITSIIIVVSLSVMILLATFFFKRDNEIRVKENNHDLAQIIASKVQSDLNLYINRAQIIASIQKYGLPFQQTNLIQYFFENNQDILFFGIAEKYGENLRLVKSIYNLKLIEKNQFSDSDIKRLHKLNDESFVNTFNGINVFHNASQGFNMPVLGIGFPFDYFNNNVKSIVIMYIKPDHFLKIFKTSGIIQAFMVNEFGDLIAHSDSKLVLSRVNMMNLPLVKNMMKSKLDNGQMRYEDENGTAYIGSFKKLNSIRLGILVTSPEEKVFEEVYNIQRRNIYILIIVLNVAILVVFFFARTLSTPIIDLVNATSQFQQENLPVSSIKGKDEIVFLTSSFNTMVDSIKDSQRKLQDYAENLENKVEERTLELKNSKKEIDDIMDNVKQGLLTINPDGKINAEYSAKVSEIFERDDIAEILFANLFSFDEELKGRVAQYVNRLFSNKFMTERMFKKLNPVSTCHYPLGDSVVKVLEFSFSRIYALDYNNDIADNPEVEKVMVVIDDKTEEYKLTRMLEEKARDQAARVEKLYQIISLEPSIFENFIKESLATLDIVSSELNKLTGEAEKNRERIQGMFRAIHSLKGNARAMNLDSISGLAHKLENEFSEIRDRDCVIDEERKNKIYEGINLIRTDIQDGSRLFEEMLKLQETLKVKHQQEAKEFENMLISLIEKEAGSLDKQAELIYENHLPDMDFNKIVLKLKNSIVHIIRNCIVHGIETRNDRVRKGKPETGNILLRLSKDNGNLLIYCRDDGAGIDIEKIKEKAVEKCIVTASKAEEMNEKEVLDLIMLPGISTAKSITEVSGRGVGMDVVKQELNLMNADISYKTRSGEYTEFILTIPI